jgi:8-oxo-dGTP pyrophosphatase MutT (NUDIX family)
MKPKPGRTSASREAEVSAPRVRPRDAATLIVLRRDLDATRLLMGRRSARHTFHPDKVVFPGGRVDAADHRGPAVDELHPAVHAKLQVGGFGHSRARAYALAAIRETLEEVGVLIGAAGTPEPSRRVHPNWAPFLAKGILPTLAPLRLVARAITPPGGNRRYDARFFAVFADAIAGEIPVSEDELVAPTWLTFEEARTHPLPRITRVILDELETRLAEDPALDPERPVPFHFVRNGTRRIEQL